MTKYRVTTKLNNVIQNNDGSFDYDQKLVSMHWTPTSEYSYRKSWQRDWVTELEEDADDIKHKSNNIRRSDTL